MKVAGKNKMDFIHIYFHTVFSEKINTKYILT